MTNGNVFHHTCSYIA